MLLLFCLECQRNLVGHPRAVARGKGKMLETTPAGRGSAKRTALSGSSAKLRWFEGNMWVQAALASRDLLPRLSPTSFTLGQRRRSHGGKHQRLRGWV